jgi:hypothetical protein
MGASMFLVAALEHAVEKRGRFRPVTQALDTYFRYGFQGPYGLMRAKDQSKLPKDFIVTPSFATLKEVPHLIYRESLVSAPYRAASPNEVTWDGKAWQKCGESVGAQSIVPYFFLTELPTADDVEQIASISVIPDKSAGAFDNMPRTPIRLPENYGASEPALVAPSKVPPALIVHNPAPVPAPVPVAAAPVPAPPIAAAPVSKPASLVVAPNSALHNADSPVASCEPRVLFKNDNPANLQLRDACMKGLDGYSIVRLTKSTSNWAPKAGYLPNDLQKPTFELLLKHAKGEKLQDHLKDGLTKEMLRFILENDNINQNTIDDKKGNKDNHGQVCMYVCVKTERKPKKPVEVSEILGLVYAKLLRPLDIVLETKTKQKMIDIGPMDIQKALFVGQEGSSVPDDFSQWRNDVQGTVGVRLSGGKTLGPVDPRFSAVSGYILNNEKKVKKDATPFPPYIAACWWAEIVCAEGRRVLNSEEPDFMPRLMFCTLSEIPDNMPVAFRAKFAKGKASQLAKSQSSIGFSDQPYGLYYETATSQGFVKDQITKNDLRFLLRPTPPSVDIMYQYLGIHPDEKIQGAQGPEPLPQSPDETQSSSESPAAPRKTVPRKTSSSFLGSVLSTVASGAAMGVSKLIASSSKTPESGPRAESPPTTSVEEIEKRVRQENAANALKAKEKENTDRIAKEKEDTERIIKERIEETERVTRQAAEKALQDEKERQAAELETKKLAAAEIAAAADALKEKEKNAADEKALREAEADRARIAQQDQDALDAERIRQAAEKEESDRIIAKAAKDEANRLREEQEETVRIAAADEEKRIRDEAAQKEMDAIKTARLAVAEKADQERVERAAAASKDEQENAPFVMPDTPIALKAARQLSDDQQQHIANLNSQLRALIDENKATAITTRKLKDKISELSERLKESEANFAASLDKRDAMNAARIQSLQGERDGLQAELTHAQDVLEKMDSERDKLEFTIETLIAKEKQQESDLQGLRDHLDKVKASDSEGNQELAATRIQIAQLEAKLVDEQTRFARDLQDMRDQLAAAKASDEISRQDVAHKIERIAQLESQRENELQELRDQLASAKASESASKQAVADIITQKSQLEVQLAAALLQASESEAQTSELREQLATAKANESASKQAVTDMITQKSQLEVQLAAALLAAVKPDAPVAELPATTAPPAPPALPNLSAPAAAAHTDHAPLPTAVMPAAAASVPSLTMSTELDDSDWEPITRLQSMSELDHVIRDEHGDVLWSPEMRLTGSAYWDKYENLYNRGALTTGAEPTPDPIKNWEKTMETTSGDWASFVATHPGAKSPNRHVQFANAVTIDTIKNNPRAAERLRNTGGVYCGEKRLRKTDVRKYGTKELCDARGLGGGV